VWTDQIHDRWVYGQCKKLHSDRPVVSILLAFTFDGRRQNAHTAHSAYNIFHCSPPHYLECFKLRISAFKYLNVCMVSVSADS